MKKETSNLKLSSGKTFFEYIFFTISSSKTSFVVQCFEPLTTAPASYVGTG